MPELKYKLSFREVLKYQLDVTVVEQPAQDMAEYELLLVMKVGQNGQLKTETRQIHKSGMLKLPPEFLSPAERTIDAYGATTQPPLAFMPVFPEAAVAVGKGWRMTEQMGDKPLVVEYELTSLQGSVAEIVARKSHKNVKGLLSETETVYEFCLDKGRVLLAQSAVESETGAGRSLRIITEYELEG